MFTGRLLPTWMFINSLCLICHTQYFKTNMPTFVVLILTDLLNIPRFNLVPQWRLSLHDKYGHQREGGHNYLFEDADYNSLYILSNMGHIILIWTIIIVALWILAFLKDMFVYVHYRTVAVKNRNKRIRAIFWLIRHEPWMHNFFNRFLYETFFELCLCAMIAVANSEY